MDFGTLLHMAKKNSQSPNDQGKFYCTKFSPPKKETKSSRQLSENIQKFLQRREKEEMERQRKQKEQVASLLAMRDEKSKNKIKKMLKVTKSANKSVLDDAISTNHTAVTLDGPDQPDQDDYGYVSTEANAFYQKYIEKVKDVKEDKGFAPSRPQSLKDLTGTKERVKAAINKEAEDKKFGSRHRTSTADISSKVSSSTSSSTSRSHTSSKPIYEPEAERREEERKKQEEQQKKARNRKPMPPPMDFQALLKLAEKKQHEPIQIEVEPKKKEPERLMTSKEKRELEERERTKRERERRDHERNSETSRDHKESAPARMEPNGRIPKLNQSARPSACTTTSTSANKSRDSFPQNKSSNTASTSSGSNGFKKVASSHATPPAKINSQSKSAPSSSNSKPHPSNSKSTPNSSSKTTSSSAFSSNKPSSSGIASKHPYNGPTREFPPRDMKTMKSKQFPPPDVQTTRQFPPPDVRRRNGSRPGEVRKPQTAPKRRIIDDDDEDEYDSELDDFIDDGDCEDDYSSHIKAIFGYDKSKYRDVDDDDTAMESSFAQVQREEYISKKLGIQEDLEDMKLEALEKKRKISKKKKLS